MGWRKKFEQSRSTIAPRDEPDNRTRDVVERVSTEVDRLSAIVTQLEQTVAIFQHLEERRGRDQ
jgi:hypothetical protein